MAVFDPTTGTANSTLSAPITPVPSTTTPPAVPPAPTDSTVKPSTVISASAAQDQINKIKATLDSITAQVNAQKSAQTTPPPAPAPAPTPTAADKAIAAQGPTFYFTRDNSGNVQYYQANKDAQRNTTYSPLSTNPFGGDQFKNNPEGTPQFNTGGLVKLDPSVVSNASGSGITGTSTDTYISGMNDRNAAIDAEHQNYQNQLNQFASGTLPLTPNQQAQLDALQHSFDVIKAAQKDYNQSYTNGQTVSEERTGRSMYANEIASGNIKRTIDEGLAKIAEIDSKAAQAIAQMRQGFEDANLKIITTAHDDYSKWMKDKTDSLRDMHDKIVAETNNVRDFNAKQAQDTITNALNKDKFTYQQKQDAIDNALKSSQLSETKRHNLATEARAAMNNQFTSPNNNLPRVNLSGNGAPNSASQSAFLAALPGRATGDLATLIKGIAEYRINPNSVPTRNYRGVGGLTQSQVLTYVAQYDPTFSQQEYNSRQALLTQFTSGKYSQNINALNTAVSHITDIISNFNNLETEGIGNTFFTPYNYVKNALASIFGAGAPGQVALNIKAATDELVQVFTGVGATQESIKSLGTIDANSSPDQVKAYVETAVQLLAGRLEALQNTYTSGMGKPPDNPFLSTTSQQQLLGLQQAGFDIKVPALADSPILKLQAFHDADPKNANLLDQLMQADPTFKDNPQKVIDWLSKKGINL